MVLRHTHIDMPPYIPFQTGALSPIDRNVYQAYDNPYSPDNVRKQMGALYAPPTSYYGLDSQGNRKRFMFDNGQLADQAEKMLGSQEAAMLQDARLKKAKNDMAFLQSLRGGMASSQGGGFSPSQFPQAGQPLAFDPTPGAYGPPGTYVPPGSTILDSGMRNPTGGTVPLIIPPNVQALLGQRQGQGNPGPNVFGTPQNEQDARLQKLLQGRVNAENLGQQYFARGIQTTKQDELDARKRAQENLDYQTKLFGLKNAMEKASGDQKDKLELQANRLSQQWQIHQDKMNEHQQGNLQAAIGAGLINTPDDVKRFLGGTVSKDDLEGYKAQIMNRDSGLADNIGSLIAQGRITNIADLSNRVGQRLNGDQYGELVQQLANRQAGQVGQFNEDQKPFANELNTLYANKVSANQKALEAANHWYTQNSTLEQLKKDQSDQLQKFVNAQLIAKPNLNLTFDPATQTFRPRTLPGEMTDATAYLRNPNAALNSLGGPVENVTRTGTIGGTPAKSFVDYTENPNAALPIQSRPIPVASPVQQYGPQGYNNSARQNYQPDPYRFGGRPDYVSDPTHFGGAPLPPMYGPPVASQMPTRPAPVFANDGTRLVRSDAEFESLQPGTVFIGMDGRKRRKP